MSTSSLSARKCGNSVASVGQLSRDKDERVFIVNMAKQNEEQIETSPEKAGATTDLSFRRRRLKEKYQINEDIKDLVSENQHISSDAQPQ